MNPWRCTQPIQHELQTESQEYPSVAPANVKERQPACHAMPLFTVHHPAQRSTSLLCSCKLKQLPAWCFLAAPLASAGERHVCVAAMESWSQRTFHYPLDDWAAAMPWADLPAELVQAACAALEPYHRQGRSRAGGVQGSGCMPQQQRSSSAQK